MKILQLNYEYPPLGGGAGVCTRYEAEGLVKLGHEVTVLTTWFEGEKEDSVENNLRIIRVKSRRKHDFKSNPIEMLSYISHAKKYLKEHCKTHKYDIAVCHYAIPSGEVGLFLKKKFNIPYIVVSHGHDIPWVFPEQMFKFHVATYFWLKKIFLNAAKAVLLTNEMKAHADKFLGENYKINNVVIPNGCNNALFKPNYSEKSKLFKIIFVGRMVDQKDPFTFLKAIKIFAQKNIDFTVHILGDGPLKSKMEAFVVENELSDKVIFKGWVAKAEMLHAYQSASLQVISSTYEAMSIAALESLSCGQYLISTPVSGNNELIEKGVTGDFMEYRDAEGLAKLIEAYYHEKFLSGYLTQEGKVETFREKFSWDNVVNQYEDLLKEVTV
ncbi:MAG: glycosyltransferase family 4 protein [Chitinophagales bacterium]